MQNRKTNIVLRLCFDMDHENEVCRALIASRDSTEIDQWKRSRRGNDAESSDLPPPSSQSEPSALDKGSAEPPNDPSAELSKLMTRFQETMSGYVPLRRFVLNFAPTLRSAFIHNELYKGAIRNLQKEEADEEFETYAVTRDQYPPVDRQIRRLRELDRGLDVLPGAVLLSLVATFDSFIADTLRIMLRSKPERLFGSSKTIEVREVLSMSSFADVIDKVTEDEVEAIMRGSHVEQIKYIEDKLNVDIRTNYDEWGYFVEIFERRNLIAHGSNTINMHYVGNCNKHGFRVDDDQEGQKIELDLEYLGRSASRLLEFGLSLMFVLWLKHFANKQEEAYESLNVHTYELIRDGQAHVAARLLDLALFRQPPAASERVTKMMTVNLANAYKKTKRKEKAYEVISGVDWSATTDDFQICIAAIREEVERVVELLPKVAREEMIELSQFREWPVFDWIREEAAVRAKFEEVYGEPMIAPSGRGEGDDRNEIRGTGSQDSATVH